MEIKNNNDRCTDGKGCVICGKPGKAKLNGEFWLCCEHAHGVVVASLMIGQPVMEAVGGEPRFLLVPTSVISED